MKEGGEFDVIIIGGSYAGLAAAMSLGRSLRRTLVIDSGDPCNRHTPYSHNFLTQDGQTPQQISRLARNQVAAYQTVSFDNDVAVSGTKTEDGFLITTASGNTYASRKLIVATGIKDLVPQIPGFAQCWGISVIHCPYCHGYEFRNQPTGIFANGARAYHLATLVNNLTGQLKIFTNGEADFDAEQRARLKSHRIEVIETAISGIGHEEGQLQALMLEDGSEHYLKALYAAVPFAQHCDIPEALGCTLTETGHLQADGRQQTNVPGLFICGDNSSPMRSVANAVATGNLAGVMANMELTAERF